MKYFTKIALKKQTIVDTIVKYMPQASESARVNTKLKSIASKNPSAMFSAYNKAAQTTHATGKSLKYMNQEMVIAANKAGLAKMKIKDPKSYETFIKHTPAKWYS